MLSRQEFLTAATDATSAAAAYYQGADLLMADQEYDTLITHLQAARAAHPTWTEADPILDAVAAGTTPTGNTTVTHNTPMLSLDKADDDTLTRFLDRVAATGATVAVEPKLDGLAISADYHNGTLTQVATRGDGRTGEDITATFTQHLITVTGLPITIPTSETFTVRGELFMTDTDFDTTNTARTAAGKAAFVNPRNAVAGTARNTDPSHAASVTFAAYDLIGGTSTPTDHLDRMAFLTSLGITTAASLTNTQPLTDPAKVRDAITALGDNRANLGYPIDGAVIAATTDTTRNALGTGTRTPAWAVAYKYAAEEASSVLRDIEVSVGRTGRISLRATINPVFVGGATVTYATLHNPKFIADQRLAIGQTVMVKRAGDVIPRITGTLTADPTVTPWTPPATCPGCDEPWDTSSLLWRCHTPSCSVSARIAYAASRDVWDIDGMSDAIAEALTEAGLVNTIADLFDLTVDEIATTPVSGRPIGTKNATKIHDGIRNALTQPLNRQITALGIRGTGRTMGRRLASHFHTLGAFRYASTTDLANVEGVGTEKARLIRNGLDSMTETIDRLVTAGINTGSEPDTTANTADLPFTGKRVVITGTVPGHTRTSAQEAAERLGAAVSGSVSKNTDLVIIGDGAGTKADKAVTLGIPTMTADEFAALT